MNSRTVVTVTLSFAFLVLLTTGVLLYATPYNYFTGSIHIWASALLILCIILHMTHNLKTYKNHLRKGEGKWSLTVSTTGLIAVAAGLIWGLAPFSTVIEFGQQLKHSKEALKGQYTVIDLTADTSLPKLNIFFKAGSAYTSAPQPLFLGLTYTSVPQIVVWIETMEGQYVDTLYVTSKSSDSSFRSTETADGTVRRPEGLPYWSHRRGIQESDGLFVPLHHHGDLDGITAATPGNDYQVSLNAPQMGRYKLFVEVNRSYDFNEYYHINRFPEDPVYSGSGSSGQPSLIYEAVLDSHKQGQYLLKMIGHGHYSGATGQLYPELGNITTAKDILSFIVASVES